MKWIEIKVVFEHDDIDLAGELIADIFYDLGARGVVMEDQVREYEPGWVEAPETPPAITSVSAYFPDTPAGNEIAPLLSARLDDLEKREGISSIVGHKRLDEDDWAESWKAFFHPINITDTIVIKPTWREYAAAPEEIIIHIDPGMAFGTGTHPTTELCIGLIEKYLTPGQTVLDVGTGSGILTIVAAKLGAAHTTGVDNDETAVMVARQNMAQNRIPADHYDIHAGDLTARVKGVYGLVVANILSEVIVTLLDSIESVMAPRGLFIASGIILANKQRVLDKMAEIGLTPREILEKEEWVAIAAERINR
ncbi:MAG: 50S ribosomal protein L11 methyltransferase [Desulfobacteraceae bacterium]|nr:50S ribosomal protein L11 methyltransferase [Desulfobacteraceae bacterium]